MANTVPTIRIECGDTADGTMLINASDFDPAKHRVAGAAVEPEDAVEPRRSRRPAKE